VPGRQASTIQSEVVGEVGQETKAHSGVTGEMTAHQKPGDDAATHAQDKQTTAIYACHPRVL